MDLRLCDICREKIPPSTGEVTIKIETDYEDDKFIQENIKHLCRDCGYKLVAVIKDWFKKNKK